MSRLDEIRVLDVEADRGPWRWHGNTDYPEGLSLESQAWVMLGLTRRERTPEDREVYDYASYLRESKSFLTSHEIDTLDDAAADALVEERSLAQAREELLTDENGGPAYDVRLRFGCRDALAAGLAEDLAIYQVARNQGLPDDTPATDPKVYRRDIVGFRNPNARFMAEGRQAVTDLLAIIDDIGREHRKVEVDAFPGVLADGSVPEPGTVHLDAEWMASPRLARVDCSCGRTYASCPTRRILDGTEAQA